jgi:hypothetical protein
LGVKDFPQGLTPAIRFSCSSVPQREEAGMNVRYRVELSQTERAQLTALLSGGKQAVRRLKRAQILLAADAGASDGEIARIKWMFTTEKARAKMARAYPHPQPDSHQTQRVKTTVQRY